MTEAMPKEAADFIRQKKPEPGFSYEDVWREEHSYAFTVAKCMQLDLLKDIQESLADAIESGQTYDHWAKGIASLMADKGWWGRKEIADPMTGEKKMAQLGSARRLRTIWRVNMRAAFSVGVWERGQRSATHNYIMYRIGNSRRHRPEHLAWDGLVLPKDDPWWDTHMPPNGWGCKCWVKFLTEKQYERARAEGVPDLLRSPQEGKVARKPVKTTPPPDITRTYVNKRTGQVYHGIEGIDPGFEYNPGNAASRSASVAHTGQTAELAYQTAVISNTEPTESSLKTPVSAGVSTSSRKYKKVVNEVLACIDSVHGDGKLIGCEVKSAGRSKEVNGAYSRYWPPTIRLSSSARSPELTLVHEIGHYIDYEGLKHSPSSLRRTDDKEPLITKVLEEIHNSTGYKDGAAFFSEHAPSYLPYWSRDREVFARAYAQYIAIKSQNAKLLRQVSTILKDPDNKFLQWTSSDFHGILKAMDDLFKGEGWLKDK